jgi:hypothetical protein
MKVRYVKIGKVFGNFGDLTIISADGSAVIAAILPRGLPPPRLP